MNYRAATLDDIKTLLTLEQAVVEAERPFNKAIKDSGATYYDIENLILSENSYMLVVEVNSQIIATGYVQIRPSKTSLNHESHGYLGFMYVEPEYRGRGLNKTIMDRLIEWCEAKGISDFYLDVYAKNSAAVRAYEKLGFAPTLMEMSLNKNKKGA